MFRPSFEIITILAGQEAIKSLPALFSAYDKIWPICKGYITFLHKGNIIMFDEFNVPLHEFINNVYVELRPIAAVNNYYQTAFVVE